MKYKIIQTLDNGTVYEQQTPSYNKMYSIVIQVVSMDYSYIKKVEVEDDIVTINIQSGEGNAIQTVYGLKKLFIIHVEEMQKIKRKQMDLLYNHYQEICGELHEFDPDLIEYVRAGIHD